MQINFYSADWCFQCKSMYPIMKELAQLPNVEVKVINVGEAKKEEYSHILSVPTTEIIDNNGKVESLVGTIPKEKILKKLGVNNDKLCGYYGTINCKSRIENNK